MDGEISYPLADLCVWQRKKLRTKSTIKQISETCFEDGELQAIEEEEFPWHWHEFEQQFYVERFVP